MLRLEILVVLSIALFAGCREGEGGRCDPAYNNCAEGLVCAWFSGPSASCLPRAAAVAGCKEDQECKKSGRCTFVDNLGGPSCHAGSAADCHQSEVCTSSGKCGLSSRAGSAQRCEVTSDQDCERSRACKQHGQCKAGPAGPSRECVSE
jgi:hypothetical protein